MTSPTSHIHHTTAAAGTRPAAAWAAWSAAWTLEARRLTGRPDATVTVAPGAAGGAPACCVPATATIEVDANLIADPTLTDPHRAGHKRAVPAAYGALVHECAHVVHSGWHTPPGTPPVVAEVATLLEESRAEHRHRGRRRGDRRWLRHAVTTIVAPADAPADTVWHAAVAAALLLARVDAKVLYPADVRLVRAPITSVLGRKRLRGLREIWRRAHTVADTDATTMIDLAWRWCALLGIDPHATPTPPTGTTPTSRIAAAIGAVLGHLAGTDPTPPDVPGGTGRTGGDIPLTWTRRAPTDAERAAARALGARLRQARSRDPVRRRQAAATPPGRLRTRAALTASAQRAAGAVPTAQPWQRTTRRPVPDPDVAIAILVDVSGSMSAFAAPLSSAAWIVAHAAHHARAATATIAFGDTVTLLVAPGHRPAEVCDMRADSGTERFDEAVTLAERLLGLTTTGAVRLAVVVSDGLFAERQPAAQKTLDRLQATGCGVLCLAPAGRRTHTYTGVTTIAVDDPATCVALIGRAATRALTHG